MKQDESRINKSFKNTTINLVFYLATIIIAFFSRKIFLQQLGDEFIGTVTTVSNIINMLNLVELGLAGTIAYVLYKPIYNRNWQQINEIVAVFRYIYNRLGLLLIGLIAIAMPFVSVYFADSGTPIEEIYFIFIAFGVTAITSYFVSYSQIIFIADQRGYVVNSYLQGALIVKLLLQIYVAKNGANPYLWVALEALSAIVYSLLIRWRVKRHFLQFTELKGRGRELLKNYPDIVKYSKQVFVHRLGVVCMSNIPVIFLFSYLGDVMVAIYSNYLLITSKLSQLVAYMMHGMDAAVGSVVAEGNEDMIRRVYWELHSIYYLVAGVCAIAMFVLITPFITALFGSSYMLPTSTALLISINFYLFVIRMANDIFINAYGRFGDIYAPITQVILSVIISLIGGYYYGINGVLIGVTIPDFIIVCLWKPYYLYSSALKSGFGAYWLGFVRNIAITGAVMFFVKWLYDKCALTVNEGDFIGWGVNSAAVALISFLLIFGALFITSKGMRTGTKRIINFLRLKIGW